MNEQEWNELRTLVYHNPAPFKSAAITGGVSETVYASCDGSTSATKCICPQFNCPAHTYQPPTGTAAKAEGAQAPVAWLVESIGSRHLFFDREDAELFARDPSSKIKPLAPPSLPDSALVPRIEFTTPEDWIELDLLIDLLGGEPITDESLDAWRGKRVALVRIE